MVRTTPYDSPTYLTSPEDIVAYIEAAVEDGDPALIAHAEDVVARAKK
jgi:DNA-binding phage protein